MCRDSEPLSTPARHASGAEHDIDDGTSGAAERRRADLLVDMAAYIEPTSATVLIDG